LIKQEQDDFTALTRVEWMKARGYSEEQISEYRQRQEKKRMAEK